MQGFAQSQGHGLRNSWKTLPGIYRRFHLLTICTSREIHISRFWTDNDGMIKSWSGLWTMIRCPMLWKDLPLSFPLLKQWPTLLP